MYLKFGFGRTISEVGNEIRRGAMTRTQAVNIARKFDGEYPEKHIESYLNYYDMTQDEFDLVLDKWANKDLFEKIDGRWKPKFKIE